MQQKINVVTYINIFLYNYKKKSKIIYNIKSKRRFNLANVFIISSDHILTSKLWIFREATPLSLDSDVEFFR